MMTEDSRGHCHILCVTCPILIYDLYKPLVTGLGYKVYRLVSDLGQSPVTNLLSLRGVHYKALGLFLTLV